MVFKFTLVTYFPDLISSARDRDKPVSVHFDTDNWLPRLTYRAIPPIGDNTRNS